MSSASQTPDVSVIIVNWNGGELLNRCVQSVLECRERTSLEVLVVDNASQDGSARRVEKDFPDVHVIHNNENKGFAAANNQAIDLSKGRFVLLLNPDSTIPNDNLEIALRIMGEQPRTGCLGCKLVNEDGSLQTSCHNYPTPTRVWAARLGINRFLPSHFHLARLDISYDSPLKVEYVKGAYMFFRKEALNAIGGMDEQFFMYSEEADICRRLWNAGWEVLYDPSTTVTHYRARSSVQLPRFVTQARRYLSRYRFFLKYNQPIGAEVDRLFMGINLVALWLLDLIRGNRSGMKNSAGFLKAILTNKYPVGNWIGSPKS
ncbi:glycosyltransferase family 2 protein [bacterium]|nr:glycosyltransferase family 2 protein [bacterium]